MPDDLDAIRERLIAIEEDLAEVAMARLRDAIEAAEGGVPHDERRVTRARRSIEKAIALLDDPRPQD